MVRSKVTYHDYIMSNWEKEYFPHSNIKEFRTFWNKSLGDGVFVYNVPQGASMPFKKEALARVINVSEVTSDGGMEVVISESVSLGTGMHANNPWLMELPDPVSKQCWENVAAVSPGDAGRMNIAAGDLIKLSDGLEIPVFIQPGQAEGTISVALGYGHTNSGPVCNNIGVNIYPYISNNEGNRYYGFKVEKIEKTLKKRRLALTQEHYSMEGRPIVRDTVIK